MPRPFTASPKGLPLHARRLFFAFCAALTLSASAFGQKVANVQEQARRERLVLTEAMGIGVTSPLRAELLDQATLRMAGSLVFLPKDKAERVLRVFDVRDQTNLVGIFFNTDALDWIGTVRFVKSGFVRADSMMGWSPDEILTGLRAAVEADNAQRAAPLEARRWLEPPTYDAEQHRLVWSVLLVQKGAPSSAGGAATYHAVVFGRDGYFQVEVPTSADQVEQHRLDAAGIVQNLYFLAGRDFRDHMPDDPVAEKILENLLGVREFKKAEALQTFWDSDLAIPSLAGGALIGGALILALARFLMIPRRRV